MYMRFDRAGDVLQSLRETVMSYKGKAFRIRDCYGSPDGFVLVGYLIGSDEKLEVLSDDSNLDHVPPKLGYVNLNGSAIYVVRKPYRQYKRGLSKSNVHPPSAGSDEPLRQIVEEDYPSYLVAKKAVEKSLCKSIAFHKLFALDKKGLHYCGMTVGNDKYELLPEFNYLSSILEGAKKC
jgi:hypothetical protein